MKWKPWISYLFCSLQIIGFTFEQSYCHEPISWKLDGCPHQLHSASLCILGLLKEIIHQSKKQYKGCSPAKMERDIDVFSAGNKVWQALIFSTASIIPLRPRQNGRHFVDDISKCVFLDENIRISIDISLKFVPRGPTNNISALVQIIAWCRPGDRPLSDLLVVSLLTHIYATLDLNESIDML